MGRILAAVFAVAALILAAPANARSDAQLKWQVDVQEHGGPTDNVMNAETGQTLGDTVCADLEKGTTGAKEVISVSNGGQLKTSQAEVIVYWAINDLCPDQMSQRQDNWRNGA